ncbi:hypothetical protein [Sinomonas cyclohexanicum]|uniref:hypothetical protein n=1 Tax=Sinomonas cyclohexanicum TaxID=322009 RepID=UPI001E623A06|nr:hypothetical protein [Corynebacterium cyclohexanicum]
MSRVDDIRARLAAAPRGPWVHYSDGHCCDRECIEYGGDDGYEIGDIGIHNVGIPWSAGQLIANAPADLAYLLAELDKARETNTRLNLRCTKAEAFVGKTVDELRAEPGHAGFGRALANWAAADAHRKLDEMKAELDKARAGQTEAWDEGRHFGQTHDHAYPNDNPYRGTPDA